MNDLAEKLAKLAIISQTSSNSRCLLLETLTSDSLFNIFKYLTSLKDKVRLERVCRTFRQHALTFEAWANIKSIVVCLDDGDYRINEDFIPVLFFAPAISSILNRSRQNISLIIDFSRKLSSSVYDFLDQAAFSTFASTILQENSYPYQYIQELKIDGKMYPDISLNAVLLIDIVKTQLKLLELRDICFNQSDNMEHLWVAIGQCVNLCTFGYFDEETDFDDKKVELVKQAMCGKPIKRLNLMMPCLVTKDLAEIVFALTNYQSIIHIGTNNHKISFSDLAPLLPPAVRLQQIFYEYLFYMSEKSFWPQVLYLPLLYPHLTTLTLSLSGKFKMYNFFRLIKSYLTISYGEDSDTVQLPTYFMLDIYSKTWDTNGWAQQFASIANDHKCDFHRLSSNHYLFRRDGKLEVGLRFEV
jgi:hypothetical protein